MFFKPRFYLLVLLVLGGLAFNISLHASYMFQEEQLELPGLLSKAHEKLEPPAKCTLCHETEDFTIIPKKCFNCHSALFKRVAAGKGYHADKQEDCNACHSEHNGRDWDLTGLDRDDFDHAETGYPLLGAHAAFDDCEFCHESNTFLGLEGGCLTCHDDEHDGKRGRDCLLCHTQETWEVDKNSLHSGEFYLSGKHLTLSCEDCHKKSVFKGIPNRCQDCHWVLRQDDPYETKLGLECGKCHTPLSWLPANWDHGVETGFLLEGGHKARTCDTCHPRLEFTAVEPDCFSCHTADYNNVRAPDHGTSGFPLDCSLCHTTATWNRSVFDHNTTGFMLTGAHKLALCSACHLNGRVLETSPDCFSCHHQDYDAAREPDHKNFGFPVDCELCHDTNSFSGGKFDHNNTGFPLTGSHAQAYCSDCHQNGVFAGTPTDCYSCHEDDYIQAKDPDHQAAAFTTDCSLCHNTTAFTGGKYDHKNTDFALTGAHRSLTCLDCHKNGQYAGTSTECYSCHEKDYNGVKDPDHAVAGFPLDCSFCHNTRTFAKSNFTHGSTDFPLTGAHISLVCSECHVNGQYAGTPTDCYSCHEEDYNQAADPDHVAAAFPVECQLCHTTNAFAGGTFDHNNTDFPLQGAHQSASCSDCHVNGQYAGTSTVCFSCHQDDYETALDPNHINAGFPTDCTLCHNASDLSFSQGVFEHPAFPINSGDHERFECSDCHLGQPDYTQFSCTVCHVAGKMNKKHENVTGYVYDSNFCYACHPDGEESP